MRSFSAVAELLIIVTIQSLTLMTLTEYTTDLYKYSPDAVPPTHAVSSTDKPLAMATSSGLFLATIYNQSQLAERKHVARYWSINTAATTVLLSAHPSPIEVAAATAKHLAAAIFGGGCTEVFCRPSTAPVEYTHVATVQSSHGTCRIH